jgi:hypothetical protein
MSGGLSHETQSDLGLRSVVVLVVFHSEAKQTLVIRPLGEKKVTQLPAVAIDLRDDVVRCPNIETADRLGGKLLQLGILDRHELLPAAGAHKRPSPQLAFLKRFMFTVRP